MTNLENKTYKGTVKTFNGQFGFIKSDLGDTYFHKSGIPKSTKIDIGDTVEFQIEPSIKKKDSLQAFGIIIIIKNAEKADISTPNLIGILKWFNNIKGFGVIGTPNGDYFLLKSSLLDKNITLTMEIVLVFSERIEKDRKTAISCRLADNYEDWELALDYLTKPDKVVIENKHASQSLKDSAAVQILKEKKQEQILEYISNYFEKLKGSSKENHLLYFTFLYKLFNKNLHKNNKIILGSFFLNFHEYLSEHLDFKYTLWLDGYIQENDLNYIAQKLIEGNVKSYINDDVYTPKVCDPLFLLFDPPFKNREIQAKYQRLHLT